MNKMFFTKLQDFFDKHKKDVSLVSSASTKEEFKIFTASRIGLYKDKSKEYADAKYRFVRQNYLNAAHDEHFKAKMI